MSESLQEIPQSPVPRSRQAHNIKSQKTFDNTPSSQLQQKAKLQAIVKPIQSNVNANAKAVDEQVYSPELEQITNKYSDIFSSSYKILNEVKESLLSSFKEFQSIERLAKLSFNDTVAEFAKVNWRVQASRESLDSLIDELDDIDFEIREEIKEEGLSSIEEERQWRMKKGVNGEVFDKFHAVNREFLGFNWYNARFSDFPKRNIRNKKSSLKRSAENIFSAIGDAFSQLPNKIKSVFEVNNPSSLKSFEKERQLRINNKVDPIINARKQKVNQQVVQSVKSK